MKKSHLQKMIEEAGYKCCPYPTYGKKQTLAVELNNQSIFVFVAKLIHVIQSKCEEIDLCRMTTIDKSWIKDEARLENAIDEISNAITIPDSDIIWFPDVKFV